MYKNSLIFPTLVYAGEGKSDGDGNPRVLNKLDWSKKNALRPMPELPQEWETYLDQQVFAISLDYAAEIRRTVNMGIMERGLCRSFDTMIRDMCLLPSEAYFEVAFKLISDSVVDPETLACSRDPRKYLLPEMMLYRFWQFQTGCGLPWFTAKIDRVIEQPPFRDTTAIERKFYDDMKAHNALILHNHEQTVAKRVRGDA